MEDSTSTTISVLNTTLLNTTLLNTTLLNTTLLNDNDNVTVGAPGKPRTPPPLGYYGDTRLQLWTIVAPIIMTWGIAGNILSVIILVRMARKASITSTTLYLTALAISDTVILLSGPLRNWIKETWDTDVRYYSDAACKTQVYFTYFSIHFSSWILVAITTERVISVVIPHKVKIGCTPRKAGLVITAILVVIGGLSLIHPIILRLEPTFQSAKCAPKAVKYIKFRDDVYMWIDFFMSFGLPFIFLLVGNIIIVVKLYKSRQRQKKMNVSRGDGRSRGRDTKSLSILLICLSVIFLLTMAPINIFSTFYYPDRFQNIRKMSDPYKQWYDYQYLAYQHTVVNIVGYTNACFNFILYVFTGSRFRKELQQLFLCKVLRQKVLAARTFIRSTITKQTVTSSSERLSNSKHSSHTHSSNLAVNHQCNEDPKHLSEPDRNIAVDESKLVNENDGADGQAFTTHL